jgi:hypothetical protein
LRSSSTSLRPSPRSLARSTRTTRCPTRSTCASPRSSTRPRARTLRKPFLERGADERLADARAIEGSELFELVRATAVVEVYSDAATWRALGYEGPSFAKGGYLHRGFDDLDWLPDPPQES